MKPTIYISSTIYDFADLRSSLKYVLEQLGFSVLLSEYNDFRKQLDANSYESCLLRGKKVNLDAISLQPQSPSPEMAEELEKENATQEEALVWALAQVEP